MAAFVYAKAKENEKSIFIKKFNTPGFKKYLKAYESELIPLYQNFRFSREINDINPFSKPRLVQEGDHKYKLTTSLVSDHYFEEDFYEIGKECIMYFDKKVCIDDIVKISRLPEHKVVNVQKLLLIFIIMQC